MKKTERSGRTLVLVLATTFILLLAGSGLMSLQSEGRIAENLVQLAGRASLTVTESRHLLDAPFIDQRVQYPTGCEAVTAVMALQYAGMNITVDTFIDNYLPLGQAPYKAEGQWYGCDPWKAFPGDPRSESGWGCYSPVIKDALTSLLDPRQLQVEDVGETDLSDLCQTYVEKGTPVLLWATIDMDEPYLSTTWTIEGSLNEITWVAPCHCLLLVGCDAENYYFNDPLVGKSYAYPKIAVERAYAGLHQQALVIHKVGK